MSVDRERYSALLAKLRSERDSIRPMERDEAKLLKDLERVRARLAVMGEARDALIREAGEYERAKPAQIAPAAGTNIEHVVSLVPRLHPDHADESQPVAAGDQVAAAARPTSPEPAVEESVPAGPSVAAEQPAPVEPGAVRPVRERKLPTIPTGEAGFAYTTTSTAVSRRRTWRQNPWPTAFLDTRRGILAWKGTTTRVELGEARPADLLAALPPEIRRVYVTGAPWLRGAERYQFIVDAVAGWLCQPVPGWTTDTGDSGRGGGHYVSGRHPVGRWRRVDQPDVRVEIRPANEWFDVDEDTDITTVREAFVLLRQVLREKEMFGDGVELLGSPSATGRDLWSRTIPANKEYPVMSEEVRDLLRATAGQGRTELLTPPRVPERLPALVEYDATLAYAALTWGLGVGAPERLTGATFAALPENEQRKKLFNRSHWQVQVRIPGDWRHIGLLPAPQDDENGWRYPYEPGEQFTTWAGGSEVHLAVEQGWDVQVLDGLVWREEKPLNLWSDKLKASWEKLSGLARIHGDEKTRQAASMAARGIRSIILFGIGGFAQRPHIITGTVPRGREDDVPAGAEILGGDEAITWRMLAPGTAVGEHTHPEWAAQVWSRARARLLHAPTADRSVHAGALHVPPGAVVALRTDALYLTATQEWPEESRPGQFRIKGHLPGPVAAPTSEAELLAMRALGREALRETQSSPA